MTSLRLCGLPGATDASAGHLAGMTGLTDLELTGVGLTPAEKERVLAGLPRLRGLTPNAAVLTEPVCDRVAALPELDRLTVSGAADADVPRLKSLLARTAARPRPLGFYSHSDTLSAKGKAELRTVLPQRVDVASDGQAARPMETAPRSV